MELQTDPGTYALILHCSNPLRIAAGGLGDLDLVLGWYVYLGSAFGPGGVRARCRRHLRGGRPHWHIDWLRPHCRLAEIWFSHDPEHREHQWARAMGRGRGASLPFPGFGASDCDCPSHLFHFATPPSVVAFKRRVHAMVAGHDPIRRFVVPAEEQ